MSKQEKEFDTTKEQLAKIREQKGKKNRSKLVFSLIFLAAMTVLVVMLFLNYGDMKEISATFQEVANGTNWAWLLLAFALVAIYLALWPLTLVIFCHALKVKASYRDVYAIGESEHFYNGVTPFATGGQPFQVYFFSTVGVPAHEATGPVLASFGAHMIATNIYALIALAFFPFYLQGFYAGALKELSWMTVTGFITVACIGYFFNVLTLILTFMAGVSNHFRNALVGLLTRLAKDNKLGRWIRSQIPTFEAYCDNTQLAFHEILSHKTHFVLSVVVRFVAMGCFYAIPYAILRGFGASFSNNILAFWTVFFATSFAITAVVWVPTPGSTGGVDYMFAIVIASLVASGLITSSTAGLSAVATSLMWRLFTYYFPLLVSVIFSIAFEISVAKRMSKELKLLSREEAKLLPPKDEEGDAGPADQD